MGELISEEIVILLSLVALVAGFALGYIVCRSRIKGIVLRYLGHIERDATIAREHLDSILETAGRLREELGEKSIRHRRER